MSTEEHEARKESARREVNEQESETNNDLWQTYVCECGDDTCNRQVELTPEEYEQVRTNPTHFVIVPEEEHVASDVARVVEKHARFWVIEKLGEAAQVAEELDSRPETTS